MKYLSALFLWAISLALFGAGAHVLFPQLVDSAATVFFQEYTPEDDAPTGTQAVQRCFKDEAITLEVTGAILEIPAGALAEERIISLTALGTDDLPPLDPNLINVTAGEGGFRCLPHGTRFERDVRLSIAYDSCLIPEGYTPAHIRMYFYDEEAQHWVPLAYDTLLASHHTLAAQTNHFTDFITGIIKTPDAPETQVFTPTSIKDLKAADPSANIDAIAPPTANNMGTANIQLPIKIPAGRKGMQPQLALRYNSEGGNGWTGLGWDLSIPAVTIETRWGVPRYSPTLETETYTLSGEMLTPVAHRSDFVPRNTSGQTQFYPRVEGSFRKIIRHGTSPKDYWWEVTERDGTRSFYGGDGSAVVDSAVLRDDDGNIAYWGLRETRDLNGNFVRYYYDITKNNGIPSSMVEGSQIYLDHITYTGHGDEEGVFSVHFVRESGRQDDQINGRLGFKQVSADLLKSVQVKYKSETVRSYLFEYTEGAFYKTLLAKVSEADRDGQTFVQHEFDYYDEVRQGGSYKPFKPKKQWNIPSDGINGGLLVDELGFNDDASIFGGSKSSSKSGGMSMTVGGPGSLYLKTWTVGGNFNFNSSTSDGLTALVDINGDGLPDKVFRKDGVLMYRGNLHSSGDSMTFDPIAREIIGVKQFSTSKTSGNSKGVEANLDFFFVGHTWSKSNIITDTYFGDFNGDRLIDIAHKGRVYFNHLDSSGNPVFTLDSDDTPNPIVAGAAIAPTLVEVTQGQLDTIIDENPLHDVVRMWEAPFNGTIKITAPVELIADNSQDAVEYTQKDGVRLTIQHKDNELWRDSISYDDAGLSFIPNIPATINVDKGDRIFFRVQSREDGAFDKVLWDPLIEYLNLQQPGFDPNGKLPGRYKASEDFVLSAPQIVGMPLGGEISIKGQFTKKRTSDDIRLEVVKKNHLGVESLLYAHDFGWADSIQMDIHIDSIKVDSADEITLRIAASTNIEWANAVSWKPRIQYTSFYNGLPAVDPDNNPMLAFSPAVHYTMFNRILERPAMWTASDTGVVKITSFPAPVGGPDGLVTLSAKGVNKLFGKETFPVVNGQIPGGIVKFSFDVLPGDSIFIEYHIQNDTLADLLYYNVPPSWNHIGVDVSFNGGGPGPIDAGVFSSPKNPWLGPQYRGWGLFIYNGNRERAFEPIPLKLLNETPAKDPGSIPDKPGDIDPAYDPAKAPIIVLYPDCETASWRGFDDMTWITASQISSSRLGDDNVKLDYVAAGGSGATAPRKVTQSYSENISLGGSAPVIPSLISASGSYMESNGKTKILYNVQDMNADGYPDIISPTKIQFTYPTGGLENGVLVHNLGNQMGSSEQKGVSLGTSGSFSSAKPNRQPKSGSNTSSQTQGTNGNMQSAEAQKSASLSCGLSGTFSVGSEETFDTWTDVNGDGLPDKLYKDGKVAMNLGYKFGPLEYWGVQGIQTGESQDIGGGANLGINYGNGSIMAGAGLSLTESELSLMWQDVNGDGLTDYMARLNSSNDIYVKLNKGSKFSDWVLWEGVTALDASESVGESVNAAFTVCIPIFFVRLCFNPSGSLGRGVSRQLSQMSDIDGDGFPDFLQSGNDGELFVQSSTIGRTNLLRSVKRPMGGSFTLEYELTGNTYAMPNSKWALNKVQIFDGLNGDGPTRTASQFEYLDGYYDRRERDFYGFATVISTQLNTADNDAPYRVVTQEYNNQNYYEKGLLLREVMTDADGKRYTETLNTYEVRDITTGLPLAGPTTNVTDPGFPALLKTEKRFYEGLPTAGLSTATHWKYDLAGNIIQYTETGDGTPEDSLQAFIEYHNLPSVGLSSIPKSISVQAGTQIGIRRREAYIDGRANVVQIRQYLDATTSANFDMEYDDYGNLSKITRPPNDSMQRLWFAYEYDSEVHTYVVKVSDAYGLSSTAVYDYVYGQLLGSTDANGQQMKYTIDARGRITTITGPYELASGQPYTIAFEYHPDATVPYALTRHYDPETPNKDIIETYTFMDGLMRPVQVKKTGAIFAGDGADDNVVYIVSGQTQYDAFGRTVEEGQPTTESTVTPTVLNTAPPLRPTRTEYDVLDRPVLVTLPDGSQQKSEYDFGSDNFGYKAFLTKVTDPLGNVQETYTDLRERKRATRVFDPNGIWTGYRYNAISELLTVITHNNDSTQYSYDRLGRKIRVKHPDFGERRMVYDLAGNMTAKSTSQLRETIAETAAIRYLYDYQRLVQISYPENYQNQVEYRYGKAGDKHNRAGRIWLQLDASGGQEFFYGPLGEVEKTIRTMLISPANERTFVWEAKYDTWNRVQQLIYPDGEVVDYAYNRAGKVTRVTGEKSGHSYTYLAQMGYDEFEQRLFCRFGNGTTTTYAYDPNRRWLTDLDVDLPTGRRIMDNQYDYDAVGNVLGIVNATLPLSGFAQLGGPAQYTFEYDSLYRLTAATGNWNGNSKTEAFTLEMTYDNRHNIVRKNQQHERNGKITTHNNLYRYSALRPHAPDTVGMRRYTYDANGNTIAWTEGSSWQHLLWDEDDRLAAVSTRGLVYQYTYDAAGERAVKSGGGGQSVFLSGAPTGFIHHRSDYTAYVSPQLVVRESGFTKHYFIEGQRIATKLGEGRFDNKIQFNGGLTAGSLHYGQRAQWLKNAAETRYMQLALPPGVPTAQGQNHTPTSTGIPYPVFTADDSLFYIPPPSWRLGIAIGPPDPNGPPGVPAWKPAIVTNDSVRAGYGFHELHEPAKPEDARYFYHADHLGSSSYITDGEGRITQHLEYMPFGETFVDEHRVTDTLMPYRFTGKELDSETGFYYFGARYYDPVASLWLSVDPMTEKYPGWSGYNYVMWNPVKLVDPDGNAPSSMEVLQSAADFSTAFADQYTGGLVSKLNSLIGNQDVVNDDSKASIIGSISGTVFSAFLPNSKVSTAIEIAGNVADYAEIANNVAQGNYYDAVAGLAGKGYEKVAGLALGKDGFDLKGEKIKSIAEGLTADGVDRFFGAFKPESNKQQKTFEPDKPSGKASSSSSCPRCHSTPSSPQPDFMANPSNSN